MSVNTSEIIRVTKLFSFEMAHALMGHDGPCKNIHGHSYKLRVTLKGKALSESGHPKDGMIIDFSELKAMINEAVIKVYDHALVLNSAAYNDEIELLSKQYARVILVPFQPSCENLIVEMKNKINLLFVNRPFELISLRLDETATSYAEWYADDN